MSVSGGLIMAVVHLRGKGWSVFESVGRAVDGEDFAVVQETFEDRGGEDFVAEVLSPFGEVLLLVTIVDPRS